MGRAPLVWGCRAPGCLGGYRSVEARPTQARTLPTSLQRQKSAYAAATATYPKAEPAPVASSAPPASSLYSSPVVSPLPCWATGLWGEGGLFQKMGEDA